MNFKMSVSMVNQSSLVQIMRETLIYLSHLDHEDTEKQVKYHDGNCSNFLSVTFYQKEVKPNNTSCI